MPLVKTVSRRLREYDCAWMSSFFDAIVRLRPIRPR
jgi:hypothetical protein